MRPPRKPTRRRGPDPAPEDTQEMFAAGQVVPGEPAGDEETREYETVATGEGETVDGKEAIEPVEEDEETVEALDEAETGVIEEDTEVIEEEHDTEVIEEEDDTEVIEEEDDTEVIEEEAWDDEGYEDWEQEAEEVEEEPDPEAKAEPENSGGFAVWFTGFRQRANEVWSGFWGRIGSIKLPRHELNGRKILAVAGVLAIALMVGAGGYLLGKGSGDDVDQARLEGEFAGRKAGAIAGATRGYAAGFKKGRDLAFRKSYSASYKRNYIRAYQDAGMDPPKPEDVEVPEP